MRATARTRRGDPEPPPRPVPKLPLTRTFANVVKGLDKQPAPGAPQRADPTLIQKRLIAMRLIARALRLVSTTDSLSEFTEEVHSFVDEIVTTVLTHKKIDHKLWDRYIQLLQIVLCDLHTSVDGQPDSACKPQESDSTCTPQESDLACKPQESACTPQKSDLACTSQESDLACKPQESDSARTPQVPDSARTPQESALTDTPQELD